MTFPGPRPDVGDSVTQVALALAFQSQLSVAERTSIEPEPPDAATVAVVVNATGLHVDEAPAWVITTFVPATETVAVRCADVFGAMS